MVSFPYNTQIPATNDDPGFDQPLMQINNLSTSNLISVDHVGFVNDVGGAHTRVQLQNIPNSGGVPVGGYGVGFQTLFSDVINSQGEILMQRGVDARIQLTGPYSPSAVANGYTFLPGGLLLQWGTVIGVANTTHVFNFNSFNISFPSACFVVLPTPIAIGSSVTSQATISCYAFTENNFSWVYNKTTGASWLSFNWIAIGN
jgi:hypothetical protein